MVESALDAVAPGVEMALTALAAAVQLPINPVAAVVQAFGALPIAFFLGTLCAGIQSRVDALTFCVQSGLGGEAALVQPLVDTLAALIQALVDAVAAILRHGRHGCEHEQCGYEYIYISLHVHLPPFAGHDLDNAPPPFPVDCMAVSAATIVRNNDLPALAPCETNAQRTASKQRDGSAPCRNNPANLAIIAASA
jgi:hypothetical protein